jgi:glycosyltransferase involved in cell wall biosynthesis
VETQAKHGDVPAGGRALFVTTVPVTLRAFLLPLARALRSRGWQVDALCAASDRVRGTVGASDTLAAEFDRIHTVNWSRSVASFACYPAIARQVRTLVRAGNYDVIHTHTPIASCMTRLALRGMRAGGGHDGGGGAGGAAGRDGDNSCPDLRPRIIYTCHGFHFFPGARGVAPALFRRAETACLPATDILTVMNDIDEAAARAMVAACTISRTAVLRIDGIGIDMGEFDVGGVAVSERRAVRAQYAIPPEAPLCCVVAEMNENKRHGLLLDALSALRGDTAGADAATTAAGTDAQNLHLLFVGTGPLEQQLRLRVARERLPVHFTGHLDRPELLRALAAGDFGALVSVREGLPRSLMEQIAAGQAVCGTYSRGIIDVVRDERALCDASPNQVAVLLGDMCGAGLRKELAQAQYAYARSHFDADVVLPQYLGLFAVPA